VELLHELIEVTKETIQDHTFSVYNWGDSEGWIDELIKKFSPLIREYYTNFEELKKDLPKLLEEETEFSQNDIDTFLSACLKASIPDPSKDPKNKPVQLLSYRSDFAEILAMLCLEELFDTTIPVRGIRSKEIHDLPSRGIDVIGYETPDDKIHLILCEVKGSSSVKNPPGCVSGKNDSIENQLLSCVCDQEKTLQRLLAIYAKCEKPQKEMMCKILFYWQKQNHAKMKIILCPFLVREKSKYHEKDYKFIIDKLPEYNPAIIRFIIICINENLSELSKKLYEFAPYLEVHHDD